MSFESEIVPLYDLGLGAQSGRQNRTGLFLAVNFHNLSTGNTLGLNHQHNAAGYHEGDGPD